MALYKELQELAKKKPEAILNKYKVTIANRLLTDIRKILEEEENFKYLDLLDDEMLPQYSDVVLILSQYEEALKSFRSRYSHYDSEKRESVWNREEARGRRY